jgi:hypothetical protein
MGFWAVQGPPADVFMGFFESSILQTPIRARIRLLTARRIGIAHCRVNRPQIISQLQLAAISAPAIASRCPRSASTAAPWSA